MVLVFSLLFSSLAYISRSVFGVLIAAIFAFYFSKKPLVRCLVAGTATSLLMIIIQGAPLAISVSIPNILGGIILSLALRQSSRIYYLISVTSLAAITAGEYLLVSLLMMNRPIFATLQEALSKYDFLHIPEADAPFYLTCYLICFCLVMAAMKSVIMQKICRILGRHLPQLGI